MQSSRLKSAYRLPDPNRDDLSQADHGYIASHRNPRGESIMVRSKSQVNDNFTRNLQNIARFTAEQKLKDKFGNRMQKSTSNLTSYNKGKMA